MVRHIRFGIAKITSSGHIQSTTAAEGRPRLVWTQAAVDWNKPLLVAEPGVELEKGGGGGGVAAVAAAAAAAAAEPCWQGVLVAAAVVAAFGLGQGSAEAEAAAAATPLVTQPEHPVRRIPGWPPSWGGVLSSSET